jgi:hypothetical protein
VGERGASLLVRGLADATEVVKELAWPGVKEVAGILRARRAPRESPVREWGSQPAPPCWLRQRVPPGRASWQRVIGGSGGVRQRRPMSPPDRRLWPLPPGGRRSGQSSPGAGGLPGLLCAPTGRACWSPRDPPSPLTPHLGLDASACVDSRGSPRDVLTPWGNRSTGRRPDAKTPVSRLSCRRWSRRPR